MSDTKTKAAKPEILTGVVLEMYSRSAYGKSDEVYKKFSLAQHIETADRLIQVAERSIAVFEPTGISPSPKLLKSAKEDLEVYKEALGYLKSIKT